MSRTRLRSEAEGEAKASAGKPAPLSDDNCLSSKERRRSARVKALPASRGGMNKDKYKLLQAASLAGALALAPAAPAHAQDQYAPVPETQATEPQPESSGGAVEEERSGLGAADGEGGGNISGLNLSNIRIFEKGTSPAKLKGLSDSKKISNVRFEKIMMPGSVKAGNLEEMNMTTRDFNENIRVQ